MGLPKTQSDNYQDLSELSGANTSLSNLVATAINTSLISDTDSTDDLGSSSKYWANTYSDKVYLNSTSTIDGTASAGNVTIHANSWVNIYAQTYLEVITTSGSTTGLYLYLDATPTTSVTTYGIQQELFLNATVNQSSFFGEYTTLYAGGSGTLGTAAGLNFALYYSRTGNVTNLYGMYVEASSSSASYTVTNLKGLYLRTGSAGNVTTLYNIQLDAVITASGKTIATAYDLYIHGGKSGTGAITTRYGIYIGNIAGTTAYAIYTGTGLVRLGGQLQLASSITTLSNGNLSLIPNGTGYTIIGDAGTTSHTFNTNDDLLVSGRLEVNGISYLDSDLNVVGEIIANQNITIDASASAFIIIDRGAITNYGGFQFKTAGSTKASIGTRSDSTENVYLFLDGASAGRRYALTLKPNSESVFNDDGGDMDFRVEGDTDTNLFFVDAGLDFVGIGTASPSSKLTVSGDVDTGGVYKIDGVQVVSNRVIDARIDDVINSGDATTDGVIDAIVDCLVAHGLVSAS